MKKTTLFFFLFFFLLFVEVMLDYTYSIFFRTDNNLKENRVSLSEYETLKKEYEELTQNLEFLNTVKEENQISKVFLHDPYLFMDQITILKGKEEGVSIGDYVYNEKGLIGKIIEVKNHSSIVELVTNSHTVLPVTINESFGILKKEGENLVVKNITSKEPIAVGSIVKTSPYSQILGNIPVATVESVKQGPIETTLIVKPIIQIESLNYCVIGKEKKNE